MRREHVGGRGQRFGFGVLCGETTDVMERAEVKPTRMRSESPRSSTSRRMARLSTARHTRMWHTIRGRERSP